MYICEKCHNTFEEAKELKNMGGDIGESVYCCPWCGYTEEFSEAVECAICGEIVRESETEECVCEKCLTKYAGQKHAKGMGDWEKDTIFLNDFLLYVFDADAKDIENILTEAMLKRYTPNEVEEMGIQYCRMDDYKFAEYLKKEGCYK